MKDYNYFNNYLNNMNNQNIFEPNVYTKPIQLDSEKGFIRGNMFDNLYDQYRNYMPVKLNPTNQRQSLLQRMQQYNFALVDLNLYLDNYPNDTNVIKIYNNYRNMYLNALKEYENAYGPIEAINTKENVNSWVWDKNPWPWEVQN